MLVLHKISICKNKKQSLLLTSEYNSCHSDSVVSHVVIFLGYVFQDWWLYYQHRHVKLKEISQEDTRGKQQSHPGVNSASINNITSSSLSVIPRFVRFTLNLGTN